jgi:hypothetical protein
MYNAYFIIGFLTSFGWWTAGKIQRMVDGPPPSPPAIVQPIEGNQK